MKPIGAEKQRQKQRGKKEEQLKNQTEGGGGGEASLLGLHSVSLHKFTL
jgi:hypothetical protein